MQLASRAHTFLTVKNKLAYSEAWNDEEEEGHLFITGVFAPDAILHEDDSSHVVDGRLRFIDAF